MNKKIKVIELINKIYANLDVPEKVKYANKKYEYNTLTQDYKSEDGEWLFQRMHTFFGRWIEREVEILEDEEEIEEIKVDKNGYIETDRATNLKGRALDITFVNKINEISKKLNELDKKINKEE